VSDSTKGFTITELIIAMSAGSLLALTVFSMSLFFFSDVMKNEAQARMTLRSQTILTATTNDLRVASSVRETNQITDPNNGSGWNTSNPNHILIIAIPALDSSNNFIIDISQGEPYMNERVYYEDEGTLYRRTLADPNATGNKLKTTCPIELSSETCPPDGKFTDDFDDMTFILYDQNNDETAITAEARSIEMTIFMSKKVYGKTASVSTNTRVTMRNP